MSENLYVPNLNLSGKVALVSGASRGIGWAITQTLVNCGALVVACDLDLAADNLKWAAKQENYFPVFLDVTKEVSCDAAVQVALQHWGRLDILFLKTFVAHTIKILRNGRV